MEDGWKVRMNICIALWSFVNFCCSSQSEVSTDNRKVSNSFAFQHVPCRCCYRSYLDRFLIWITATLHTFWYTSLLSLHQPLRHENSYLHVLWSICRCFITAYVIGFFSFIHSTGRLIFSALGGSHMRFTYALVSSMYIKHVRVCLNNVQLQKPATGLSKEAQSNSFERLCMVSNEFETLSEMFDVVLQKNNNFEFCAN